MEYTLGRSKLADLELAKDKFTAKVIMRRSSQLKATFIELTLERTS